MWQSERVPDDEQEVPPEEVVEGVVVLAPARAIEPLRPPSPPLRQVAAVAATGFVAGAATAAVLGRRYGRSRRRASATRAASTAPVAAFEVLVVDTYVSR
jgi:hypothetical protein